jgi:uncharacterized protein YdaU (DUF1376 family)
MKHQWMPMFWGDFLANTMHLSAQEVGAYALLIAHAWEHNACIPLASAQRIARINNRHWLKVWKKLELFFEPLDGLEGSSSKVRHPRVAKELAIAAETSNKRKGAALQMHANRRARAEQMHTPHPTPPKRSCARKARSLELQLAEKQHLGISPDPGIDYRSPPRTKSDNKLEPLPERSNADRSNFKTPSKDDPQNPQNTVDEIVEQIHDRAKA